MAKKSIKISLIICNLILFLGCANGHCRNRKPAESMVVTPAPEITKVPQRSSKFIFKSDGSLQCGMGKKISLKKMSSELNGFTILSSENASDGLMHIQACGTPTGKINIFEIPEDQLEPALKRGFKEFKK